MENKNKIRVVKLAANVKDVININLIINLPILVCEVFIILVFNLCHHNSSL